MRSYSCPDCNGHMHNMKSKSNMYQCDDCGKKMEKTDADALERSFGI